MTLVTFKREMIVDEKSIILHERRFENLHMDSGELWREFDRKTKRMKGGLLKVKQRDVPRETGLGVKELAETCNDSLRQEYRFDPNGCAVLGRIGFPWWKEQEWGKYNRDGKLINVKGVALTGDIPRQIQMPSIFCEYHFLTTPGDFYDTSLMNLLRSEVIP